MNDDFKNGLLVAGVAVIAYLLYKEAKKTGDVIVAKKEETSPAPIEVGLPIESVTISQPILNI